MQYGQALLKRTPMQCVGKFCDSEWYVWVRQRRFMNSRGGFPTCSRIRNATVNILIGSHFQRLSKRNATVLKWIWKNGEFLPSLKIKLFDKIFKNSSKIRVEKVKSLKIKLFWQKSLKIKLFENFLKNPDFQTFWSKIRAEKVKSLKIKLFKLFEKNRLAEKSLKTFKKVWKINFFQKNRPFLD